MIKKLFPFSLKEYLEVLGCYVVFFAVSYLFSFLASASVSNSDVNGMTAGKAISVLLIVALAVIVNFVAYSFVTMIAYLIAAKKKFQIRMWPKYIFSFLILILIFLIPFLFAIRLALDNNPASITVFIVVLFIALHFMNLTFLFTAFTGKTFQGIRKGFWFGTVKIKHLIVPYLWFLGASLIFSVIMLLLNIDFLNLMLSGVLLSWAVLYVGRKVIKKIEKGKK